ncbi:MAG: hypothetical protein JWP92_548, partial [Caulobacter sp.]|nr:hypothetical protein [Caulobacter sp.]
PGHDGPTIYVGVIGRNAVIDGLIKAGKLDVGGVTGQWEGFVQQVVDDPEPGVARGLVIAGADKRGAIFGAYDLSEKIGVSPWSWWADVPTPVRPDLYLTGGRAVQKPAVKYRGIFINDEDPAFSGWAKATFGGVNHAAYETVYELILRMKGNYLWPAMWGKSIYDDDPLSAPLADMYGVVIGTSHHEPLMRAHVEWERYGKGPWDYTKNAESLRAFWREGVERMGSNESLVTVGMRGDGDEPMTAGTATQLLETIVADQRKIIAEVTRAPPEKTHQVWALYKEVQDYYDKGMRVPDDVTLLFADDNWGNIRRLPEPGKTRAGGYGVYYHFDYVGGPRNYKWINTNQIERTWEQMGLAHDYGADQLWIVNVGDIKPMEFPIEFFLDYAWNPDAMPVEAMAGYTRAWAAQQFGEAQATDIADLLATYTRWNARRKPELLDASTFSLVNYDEAQRVVADWDALEAKALRVGAALPKAYGDAYFQLVRHPIQASANLNRLYVATAKNRLYAAQGRASANAQGEAVKALFARDAELSRQYNEDISGGKWRHMMDQTHIGYTTWRDPKTNILPALTTVSPPAGGAMGVAVEGRAETVAGGADLPGLDVDGVRSRWIEVFNRGQGPARFTATAGQPWVKLGPASGDLATDARIAVTVDWKAVPAGVSRVPITITGDGGPPVTITAVISNPGRQVAKGAFVEAGGPVAIEAEHYARAVGGGGVAWKTIPNLGRTLSGVAAFPTTAPSQTPGPGGSFLEYAVNLDAAGDIDLRVVVAPSLDFRGQGGLRYAVSLDDGAPTMVNLETDPSQAAWNKAVADSARISTTRLTARRAGPHKVRLWRVDPGVVFERLVLSRGAPSESYLGPPESVRR